MWVERVYVRRAKAGCLWDSAREVEGEGIGMGMKENESVDL